MQFPRTEAEIAALAEIVVQGLEQATEDLPAPPVPPADLRIKLDAVHAATAAAVGAESAFREHHATKDEVLENLADSLKANLKYAEFAVKHRPEKLSQLGWGQRRCATALEAPGESATSTSSVNGAKGNQIVHFAFARARYRIWRSVGLSADYILYMRNSFYKNYPDIHRRNPEFRLGLSFFWLDVNWGPLARPRYRDA